MWRVLVKEVACGSQSSTGLPDPLVLPGSLINKRRGGFSGPLLGGVGGLWAGRGGGRTELRISTLGTIHLIWILILALDVLVS